MTLPTPARAVDLGAAPMLLAYFVGGLVSLAGMPTLVHDALGHVLGTVWVWLLIVGPLLSLASIFLPNQWAGMWLRLSGSLMCVAALGAWWIGTVDAYGWTAFTAWVAAGLTVTTILVTVYDAAVLRRIVLVSRVMS